RSSVICSWRQTRRDVAGRRRTQTADSLAGLPAIAKLETRPPHLPRATDGIVSAARRSPAQLPGGPCQESFLLLWLRTWRRSHSLRRTLLRRGILRSEEHTSELQSRGHLVCRLLLEKKNQ